MKITKRMGMFLLNMLLPVLMMAQGWPANYQGVMLQGFYWDSYEDTKWTNLTAQADELSKYFKLIWVPNSGQTKADQWNSAGNWGFENMGYMPVYWLKHNTCFGTEAELKTMINTFKTKGTGFIEDVVINHKNGLTNWADFPDESVTVGNKTYTIDWADNMSDLWGICRNDELFDNGGVHDNVTYSCTTNPNIVVNNDEGDNFDGCRDLDHTNATVQANIKTYLDYLLNELGYVGFRYDMVKGYAGYYVGKYNSEVLPEYSVGEYWDASYSNTVNWINETGRYENFTTKRSAAFDFPLKYKLNEAFNNNNWGVLSDKGIAGDPNMSRYSVTFVDNHDTYRNDYDRVNNNVLAANAFILALPGTPCIFLPHWQQYKTALKKMIIARNKAGINNQSSIISDGVQNGGGYLMKVQGSNGSVVVISGYVDGYDAASDGYTLVLSGDNFAYYIDTPNYNANDYENLVSESSTGINVYVKTNKSTAFLYAWNNGGTITSSWPGNKLTEKVTLADGTEWYKMTLGDSNFNMILNDNTGDSGKTIDINSITEDKFIVWNGGNNFTDVTNQYEEKTGKIYAYFERPSNWGSDIYAWAWNDNTNFTGGNWPGTHLPAVGMTNEGNYIYRWEINASNYTGTPTMIKFTDNNNETSNFTFVNGGYYTTSGKQTEPSTTRNYDELIMKGTQINTTTTTTSNWNGSNEAVAQFSSSNFSKDVYVPAGTYTVQAIVRGTANKTANLNVGTSGNSVTMTGLETTSASTVATTGYVADGTNNGWQKVQTIYTLAEDGLLHITITTDATTWQIGEIRILKDADTNAQYQTTATTTTRQTWVDMTGQSNFSFFELGVNKNALVKSNSAILSKNNVVNGTCANLKLTDGAYDFGAGEAFTVSNVTYDRAFTATKKVTVCLPFAVTAAELTAMNAKAYEFTGIVNGNVKFTEVTEMAANTPYVFVSSSDQTPFSSLGNKSIVATPNAMEVTADGVTFTGTMTRQTLNEGTTHYYGYSGGDFVKVGSNVGINPFRAYLKTTESLGAKLQVVFNDEVDGISLTTEPMNEASSIYDLSGRIIQSNKVTKSLSNEVTKSKSSTLPKGIYIVREGHGANAKTRKIIIK